MANSKALNEFVAAKAEIDAMLDCIKESSDNHFGVGPDDVNWGHVGTLNHYRDKLREITSNAAFDDQ